jgi:hypothetical protein
MRVLGKGKVRRRVAVASAALALLALAAAGSVIAANRPIKVIAGNLQLVTNGGFSPTKLPRNRDAPITIQGWGALSTRDGSFLPALRRLIIEFDRHGHVETRGLPRCARRKLENTLVRQARRLCPGAIVGKGFGKAIVKFPDQAPIPASSPITLFNGPRVHGDPTVIAHAHINVPAPTTYVVPIRIERINKGRYGYRVNARIPRIAGGYGSPTYGRMKVSRFWRFRGRRLSYVNARCPDRHLQARFKTQFDTGISLQGTIVRPCQIRHTRRSRRAHRRR